MHCMAIRNWHPGKLIILWAWGTVFMGLAFVGLGRVNASGSPGQLLLGFALLGILFGTPLFLSLLTWKWLSGRDKDSH